MKYKNGEQKWIKKIILKIVRVIIQNNMMEVEDTNFDNISLDEKSYENILAYSILHKETYKFKTTAY